MTTELWLIVLGFGYLLVLAFLVRAFQWIHKLDEEIKRMTKRMRGAMR